MTIIKILSFLLLFFIALLPVIFDSEKLYNSNLIKTLAILLLIGILLLNIKMAFLENKEKDKQLNERQELKTKIDLQSDKLSSLQAENIGLKSQIFSQMERIKLSAELDNFISHFDVYVIFDKTYSIEEISPASFGYDFYLLEKDLAFTEVFVTDENMKSNKGLMLSYKIYDVKKGGNTIGGSLHGSFTRFVNGLQSKITILPNTYKIRDIQNGRFEIILDQSIVDKAIRIVFTSNDWILINQSVDSSKWEKLEDITKLGGWQNYGLDQKTFYRIKPEFTFHNPNNPWIVEIFEHPLQKLK